MFAGFDISESDDAEVVRRLRESSVERDFSAFDRVVVVVEDG